jgi:ribosomal protein S18 acetylase RimI-like enzyme
MCVVPASQRKGIGRELLGYMTGLLQREGVTKIYLITAPDSGASAFYSAHGYYVSRRVLVMGRALDGA